MSCDTGSGSIKSVFKHTWLFAVSIQRVKMAPELVVFLFLCVRVYVRVCVYMCM